MNCANCGSPLSSRDKFGEVKISLSVRPGVSMTITKPICLACAVTADQEATLALLRMLAKSDAV